MHNVNLRGIDCYQSFITRKARENIVTFVVRIVSIVRSLSHAHTIVVSIVRSLTQARTIYTFIRQNSYFSLDADLNIVFKKKEKSCTRNKNPKDNVENVKKG